MQNISSSRILQFDSYVSEVVEISLYRLQLTGGLK